MHICNRCMPKTFQPYRHSVSPGVEEEWDDWIAGVPAAVPGGASSSRDGPGVTTGVPSSNGAGAASGSSSSSVVGAASGSSSSSGVGAVVGASSSSGAASSSSGVCAAPPEVARDERGEVAKRGERGASWGPYSLATVVSKGIHIGWGASCGLHHNAENPDTECKRQLSHGKRAPMSDLECRSRLKAWLLMGKDIPPGPYSREQHMLILPREIEPVPDEADLDRQASEI